MPTFGTNEENLEVLDYARDYCSVFRRYSPEEISNEVFGSVKGKLETLVRP